jgi:hypothetical protein
VTFLENFLKMATSTSNLQGQSDACSDLGVILNRRRQYKVGGVTRAREHTHRHAHVDTPQTPTQAYGCLCGETWPPMLRVLVCVRVCLPKDYMSWIGACVRVSRAP